MSEQKPTNGEEYQTAVLEMERPEADLEFSDSGDGTTWSTEQTEQPRRRRRTVFLGAGVAAILALGGGAFAAANAHKVVDLQVEGALVDSASWSGTVGGLLEENGIELGEHDVVIPSEDTVLTDGTSIQVLRAQPVAVLVDGEPQELWTVAKDAGSALAAASLEGGVPSMAVTREGTTASMDLPLDGDVRVVSMDGEVDVTVPAETPLQEAIETAGLSLGELDEVAVTADADGTAVVTIVRVGIENRVTTVEIPYSSSEVESDDYYTGTSRVTTAGVPGVVEQTFEVIWRDGEVVSEEMTAETTVQEVVNEVITVGTKARPVASSSSSSSSSSGTTSTVSGDVWSALAQCESGGNPSIVSSNGKYHGLYQFTVSTWQSVGGSGLPSQASASEQTERAKALQARSGWGQWPACARKLGLL